MGDWIENNLGWLLLAVIALMIGGFAWGITISIKQDNQLMAECIADGHKKYECYAMLKNNSHSSAYPVIIPVRH